MYDIVVIGQGLAGLLTAIRAKENNNHVAVVSKGIGKIIQSTAFMDLLPGRSENLTDARAFFVNEQISDSLLSEAADWFKALTGKLGLPYRGSIEKLTPVLTGAGFIKQTALYPHTVSKIPEEGDIIIAGIKEIIDFQPRYVKENLLTEYPGLSVSALSADLGLKAGRVLSQADVARQLDEASGRAALISALKKEMKKKNVKSCDMMVLPSCLGIKNSQLVMQELKEAFSCSVTEAPGLPPNAAAVRLYSALKKYAVNQGIRFIENKTTYSVEVKNDKVTDLFTEGTNEGIKLKKLVIATGGIIGGGLELTTDGLRDTTINQPVNKDGTNKHKLRNVYYAGGTKKVPWTDTWIAGGIYTICTSYSVPFSKKTPGGKKHAGVECNR
ncbi:FAD-binding protein [Salipaludibacillus aurantiacus]|uniref:Glycerol-3-phosphate dehydrogenase subunit B n=1 Tax=Salipaludibacillus aurantiacus TaxID=1601833 RepID=A0A1H9RDH2_9BACI|nr:FAD-binding protein [Salipaludibacillus aurantiacus]SER69983.1 glycerol-3-phosphate dehydrogenase subunit B [Salipaludibacillus aurantiacus]